MAIVDKISAPLLLGVGLVVRLALIAYGEWQDAVMTVKYTDIDYVVFTDASRFIHQGGSPYERSTYRYTPMLAQMLIPNITLHPAFGKVVFALADIAIGMCLWEILRLRKPHRSTALACLALWLFNPITAVVSTRGNAESIIALLVVLSLYLLFKKYVVLSAIVYGLSIHFKIYPILFSVPLMFFIDSQYSGFNAAIDPKRNRVWQHLRNFFHYDRVVFVLVTAVTVIGSVAVYYRLYGYEFLFETYLYHIGRTDHRHNFSLYFYQLYLSAGAGHPNPVIGVLLFLPQVVILAAIIFYLYKDITLCIFLQTVTFVVFNKVITVQYFVWYFSLLPLIIPQSTMSVKRAGFLAALWEVTQLHWLQWGYQLEFLGKSVYPQIFIASAMFFLANIYAVREILSYHQFTPVFIAGRPVQFLHYLNGYGSGSDSVESSGDHHDTDDFGNDDDVDGSTSAGSDDGDIGDDDGEDRSDGGSSDGDAHYDDDDYSDDD